MVHDKSLLLALKKGDHDAFEQLYHRHGAILLAKLDRMVPNELDANDLLHDIFIRVWESKATINPAKPFAGYLYRIGQRLLIDYYRTRARHSKYLTVVQNDATTSTPTTNFRSKEDVNSLLLKALQTLPEKQRLAFEICKLEGKSYKEAAEILNIKPETVHTHIRLANAKLRKSLSHLKRDLPGTLAVLFIFEKIMR